jgi:ABC-2 type transport system ATP-binding protein
VLAASQGDRLELDRATVRLRTQDSAQVLSEVLPGLEQAGLRPSHLLVRDPSMDDVFLALTGRPSAEARPATAVMTGPGAAGNDRPAGGGSTA